MKLWLLGMRLVLAQEPCDTLIGATLRAQARELDAVMRAQLGPWSDAQELALGQALMQKLAQEQGFALDQDSLTRDALQAVLDRVQGVHAHRRFQYQVHLIEDEEENASALPGGHILVHRGLLRRKVQSEGMLAFVLGHELAHVERGHAAAVYQYLAALPLLRQDAPGELLALARHSFSVHNELEADRLGAVLASLAGYAASEGVAFWSQDWPPSRSPLLGLWGPEAQALPSDLRGQIEEVLMGHPPPEARACAVLEGEALLRARTGQVGELRETGLWPPTR